MSNYINKSLDKFNPIKFNQFLFNLGVNESLDELNNTGVISEQLWEKILDIQRKGGAQSLLHNLNLIKNSNDEISKKIKNLDSMIQSEEQEDKMLREMFSFNWNRSPSSALNTQCIKVLTDYKQKVVQAKNCDDVMRTQIFENMKYLEMISASREALTKHIPTKQDQTQLKSNVIVQNLCNQLKSFRLFKEELLLKINNIILFLRNENIFQEVFKILKKQATEEAVFEQEKKKYDLMIIDVEEIFNKMTVMQKSIIEANEKFNKLKFEKTIPDNLNDSYFQKLENSVTIYNQKSEMINQGIIFYNELNMKLNEATQIILKFLTIRETEKRQMLKMLNPSYSGNFNHEISFSDSYLDKNVNPITNLQYQYEYKDNKFSYDGKNKNNN